MSLSDFLFQGSAPPSVTTYGSTSSSLPPWFEAYQQALLGRSNVIAGEPYQPFQAPDQSAYDQLSAARIAPFSSDTTTGWDMGRNMATEYKPTLNVAEQGTRAALQTPGAAGTTTPMIQGALSNNAYGRASGYLDRAGEMSVYNAGKPALDQAMGMPTGYDTASGYLSNAAQQWPDQYKKYLNPFTDTVAKGVSDLSTRNLLENVLPNVNSNFVKAGMFGAQRHGDVTERVVRDNQESLQRTLGALYSDAYNSSANIFGNDANRSLQVGSTAGNLRSQDMRDRLSAATTAGNLTNLDVQNLLQNANLRGALTTNDINSTISGARAIGDITNMDRTTSGNLGTALSNIAGQDQRLGLTGAAILEGIGQQRESKDQALKDLMYNNFVEQRNYPRDMAAFMNSMIRGLQAPTSVTTSNTAPTNNYNAPPFAQILGAATGLAGLYNTFNKARGGRINRPRRRPAEDIEFEEVPRGALSYT